VTFPVRPVRQRLACRCLATVSVAPLRILRGGSNLFPAKEGPAARNVSFRTGARGAALLRPCAPRIGQEARSAAYH